ncbi:hypothetical protein [uncultured Shimia sp.]|uniref:hypothetical protein n=1 Tax=uncultured Shimia sp. TaxID=573152 RepID=UPI00261B0B92|nr:hypothetical protein [uncultured Shimia sp.]
MRFLLIVAGLLLGSPALADMSPAVDGCIDQLRKVGGPDARNGGEVLSQQYSQAGTLVKLRDAGGTVWECIGYEDGAVGDLRVVEAADDGQGAMAGSAAGMSNQTGDVQVKFAKGTSGATLSNALGSSDAVRYVLGARSEQFLNVELRGNSDFLNYIIYVPSGDILFESSQGGYKYRGQLYESGDHVVEVFYNGDPGTEGAFDILFQID